MIVSQLQEVNQRSLVDPREADREFDGDSIDQREAIEFGMRDTAVLPAPILTGAKILGFYTWMIKWNGDKKLRRQGFNNIQSTFLFPFIQPNLPELEVCGPGEWDIDFVGTVQNLIDSDYHKFFKVSEEANLEDWIAIIRINHEAYGFQGQPLHGNYYIGGIVMRMIKGDLVDEDSRIAGGDHIITPLTYQAARLL